MTTWIISDLHFGHKKVLEFYPKIRGQFGSTVEEMDEGMIVQWNKKATSEDRIYILGDISFYGAAKTTAILDRLNGEKILVVGNHDHKALRSEEFCRRFVEIHRYLELKINKQKIIMMHYPISDWNMRRYGSIQFHGHCHGRNPGFSTEGLRIMDVGVDATGEILLDLNEHIELLSMRPIKP